MITADFHMHTSFSLDSEADPRDMVERAISLGLKTICFTDHNDKDYPIHEGETGFDLDIDRYMKTMSALQEEYKDKIRILIGVEIGLQEHLAQYHHQFVMDHPFDFVIGSMHVVHGMDPYYGEIFKTKTDEEVYRETFLATIDNIRDFMDYDVLGHIDYVVRYGKNQAADYSYRKYADEIDEILRIVIANGKGIELNTAGLKYGLDFCHPHPDVLKRYRELGGEIITVGADGHAPEHIAYDFNKVSDILKDCGFKYYTEFSARKPYFKQLP